MVLLRSEPFTVSRVEVARTAAEAYVRSFWWFIIPGPLFGLAVVALSQNPQLQAIGMLGVFWPLSIPARAYFISGGLARRLSTPTVVSAMEDGLYFSGERAQFKIGYSSLRRAEVRHGSYVLRTRRFEALVIPGSAFPGAAGEQFLRILGEHGVVSTQTPVIGL